MNVLTRWGGISAAAAALAIFALTAQAQQPGTPAGKAPAAKSEIKKDTPKKESAKKGACKTLNEAACKARDDCVFREATTRKLKTGKEVPVKASCAAKPKEKAPKAATKMDDKKGGKK